MNILTSSLTWLPTFPWFPLQLRKKDLAGCWQQQWGIPTACQMGGPNIASMLKTNKFIWCDVYNETHQSGSTSCFQLTLLQDPFCLHLRTEASTEHSDKLVKFEILKTLLFPYDGCSLFVCFLTNHLWEKKKKKERQTSLKHTFPAFLRFIFLLSAFLF